MENENVKLTKLYYKGTWILRTTETGIEVNGEVAWYRIVWAYTKYLWFKVRDWLRSQARGNLGRQ
jgi:hypothetical protein